MHTPLILLHNRKINLIECCDCLYIISCFFLLRMLTQMNIIIILLYHKLYILCSFYNCDLMCYVIHVILEKIDTQSLQGFIEYILSNIY